MADLAEADVGDVELLSEGIDRSLPGTLIELFMREGDGAWQEV